MAKSIAGGVEIINTLSTKNDGDYPLVKAESVGMNDGSTAEEIINNKLDKNQGALNKGKVLGIGADGNVIPVDAPSGGGGTGTVEVDTTLTQSGKAADSKTVGDKFKDVTANVITLNRNIENKLDKNQGVSNKGKIIGVGEDGNATPLFPNNVTYNPETKNLEYGSNDALPLSDGIKLDTTLTKEGCAASAKETGDRLKSVEGETANLKEDLNKLIEYKQEEQEYRMDDLVTGNWDSIGSGGYYDENGKYVANPSYRHGRINMRRTRYKLFVTTQNPIVLFIHVFNGEPSEQTFVKRYTAADFPTESNPLIVEPNQIVIVQNTPNVIVRLKANNKVYYEYGQIIKNITDMAGQAKDTATLANKKADKANATADSLEPSVERTKVLGITKSMMQFIGNKYPSVTGSLYDNSGYWGYTYVIPEDGDFYIRNLGDSSFGFLAIYNESVADGNLAMNIESGATFATRYLTKGQIVLVSYALTTTDESKVRGGNITHTYKYTERPTMFIREMNVAWFGDSISQLQLLPHRVAEYMGITVNDVSFAGAPLTYSTTAYQGTGFMSLSSQIANGDFTDLEKALSNQGTVSEDKRGNANRLKALDFSTITDIVVMAGTNDINNDYVATSTDLTKFKNGMKLAIDTIITAYPQINLYFISNPYRGDITVDKHGNTLADFVQAEKEVCDEYNIPYYDLYHNSGINAKNISYYLMEDMLHQNEKGDILMAKKIAKWLISN